MKASFVVKAENLSKLYNLRGHGPFGQTLREVLSSFFNFKRANLKVNPATEPFWAIKGIDLEIKEGEVVGIIGRNGAGKSTLLKILSRITEPTLGTVRIHGRIGSLLEVGTGFHPELSGRDNIFLNGSILGMGNKEIKRKFDEIVNFAEVEKFIDTPVKRYSSGMYVRLAFAVAAYLEPEILLIDEVLSVGDVSFQKKCFGKIGEVTKEGRTVLFVSHNTAALLGLCKRGILLEQGEIVSDGPIDSVVQDYMKPAFTNASGDLSSIENRQGDGKVRFTQVTFEDALGRAVEHGVSGHPFIVKLHYRASGVSQLFHCRVSVTFYDNLGQALFNCSSDLVHGSPVNLDGCGVIKCIIPRLPLSSSRYFLTLFFEVSNNIEDWLHHVVELEVIDGDYFGTGRLYPTGWQGKGVLVPHTWVAGDGKLT